MIESSPCATELLGRVGCPILDSEYQSQLPGDVGKAQWKREGRSSPLGPANVNSDLCEALKRKKLV